MELNCKHCEITFNRNKNQSYCSHFCALTSRKKAQVVKCYSCHKEFERKISEINKNKTKTFFCSKGCYVVSPEIKQLISIGRKAYLKNNPEKHPWKRNSKFKSIPCEKFKEILTSNSIEYIEEFVPGQEHSYSIDIAFPDKKIGIEINGNQHYERTGELKDYYKKRSDYIESLGWKLYEIHYSLCFNEPYVIDLIKIVLNADKKLDFNYQDYIKTKVIKTKEPKNIKEFKRINGGRSQNLTENSILEESNDIHFHQSPPKYNNCKCGNAKMTVSKLCHKCNNHLSKLETRKVKRPSREEFHWLVWNYSKVNLSKKFLVSDNAIKKWAEHYKLNSPNIGYWQKIKTGNITDYQI